MINAASLAPTTDMAETPSTSAPTSPRMFAKGDLVKYLFDTGARGFQLLYGVVIQAGPKRFKVKWESGIQNRLNQGHHLVELVEARLLGEVPVALREEAALLGPGQKPVEQDGLHLYSFTHHRMGPDSNVTLTNAASGDLNAVELALMFAETWETTVRVVLQSGQQVTVAPKVVEKAAPTPKVSRKRSVLKKTPQTSTDLDALSVGDRIRVNGSTFEVTYVDAKGGKPERVAELRRPESPKMFYTLMRHAKEPGMFVLHSRRSSRVIDAWRMA